MTPLEWIAIISLLGSGAVGALGAGSALYFRGRAKEKRRRTQMSRHLKRLQRLSAKLINAFDHLLDGDAPEETILYQRFIAHGGSYYPELQTEIHRTIKESRHALYAAFDLHQKLVDPKVRRMRSLEQQILDWEILVATLIGPGKHVQNLSADEIRALLDPMLPANSSPKVNVQLAKQLNELRQELTEQPLEIRWQSIKPFQVGTHGILDYVDRAKKLTAKLREQHRQEALRRLAEIKRTRQDTESSIPFYLPELYAHLTEQVSSGGADDDLSIEQIKRRLFSNIDARLKQTEARLKQGQYLNALEHAEVLGEDLGAINLALQTFTNHGRRQTKIDAIAGQGYRPPGISADLDEIGLDIQTIARQLLSDKYQETRPWVEEFNIDSQRALNSAEMWQALHHKNLAKLDQLKDEIADLNRWWQQKGLPAWEKLQAHPRQNWAGIGLPLEQAIADFHKLRNDQLNHIDSLNSIEVQQFADAERMLVYTRADLSRIEQQFRKMVNRLAQIKSAAANLPQAFRLTEADLSRAKNLRDREDQKITPDIDQMIETTQHHLKNARRLADMGHYIDAVAALTQARKLATTAYGAADEQVREINALLSTQDAAFTQARTQIKRCAETMQQLPEVARTTGTIALVNQLQDAWGQAKREQSAAASLEDRALAQAVRKNIAGFQRINQKASWTLKQVATDEAEYREAMEQTQAALAEARKSIWQAEQEIGDTEKSSVGLQALRRARMILRAVASTNEDTKEALARIRNQANEATRYARLSQNQAKWKQRRPQNLRQSRRLEQDDDNVAAVRSA